MSEDNGRSIRSQSSSDTPTAVQSELEIDPAFQLFLQSVRDPQRTSGKLNRAIAEGEVQIRRRELGAANEPVRLPPEQFSAFYTVVAHEQADGWHADVQLRGGIFGGEQPRNYIWTMVTEEIKALCEDETPSDTSPLALRRGPKGYGTDIWELFKARLYIKLASDGVPADADINIEQLADKLMLWGQNHPRIGERKTPSSTAMRERVKGWCPLWKLLGVRVRDS